jgi:hypothetical protein
LKAEALFPFAKLMSPISQTYVVSISQRIGERIRETFSVVSNPSYWQIVKTRSSTLRKIDEISGPKKHLETTISGGAKLGFTAFRRHQFCKW